MEPIDLLFFFFLEMFLIWILYILMLGLNKATRKKNKFLDVMKTVASRFLKVLGLLLILMLLTSDGGISLLHPFALAELVMAGIAALFFIQFPIVLAGYTFFQIREKIKLKELSKKEKVKSKRKSRVKSKK